MSFFNTENRKSSLANFSTVLWFGKYKGRTILDVYSEDVRYLAWLLNNTSFLKMSAEDIEKISVESEWEDRMDVDPGLYGNYKL